MSDIPTFPRSTAPTSIITDFLRQGAETVNIRPSDAFFFASCRKVLALPKDNLIYERKTLRCSNDPTRESFFNCIYKKAYLTRYRRAAAAAFENSFAQSGIGHGEKVSFLPNFFKIKPYFRVIVSF